jgi:Ni/Co efflux regulator RcnB
MKERTISLAAVLVIASMTTSSAWAQGQSKAKAPQTTQTAGDKVREVLPASEPVFATREVSIIQGWFRTNLNNLPPGLAKRETLPPGLQKQLVQRGTLPPGLQKKIQPLPIALERQLSPIPTGYRRVVVAGNVILMNPTTGLIYDIVRNVIP